MHVETIKKFCLSSGFRCEVDENCALLGSYVAVSGNYLPTFQDYLSVLSSKAKNHEIGMMVVGRKLQPFAA